MKKGIFDLLKGKFLISDDAFKNWRFIVFVSFLAVIMIASSHSADQKVHELAQLNERVKELRSEFVDVRAKVQQLKLESSVMAKVADKGLIPSETPPKKIKVLSEK
ncbi:FtsL-like putative cell division protein [Zhouia sp. PK063]|uniref:FtsL-like putative cell division protein n=1 Tax=Zhouia sp. PK063 TaxID=3373602 RepID=UPI003792DC8B